MSSYFAAVKPDMKSVAIYDIDGNYQGEIRSASCGTVCGTPIVSGNTVAIIFDDGVWRCMEYYSLPQKNLIKQVFL